MIRLMPLEQRDILQINVIVIAGALIFLTLIAAIPTRLNDFLNSITAVTISTSIIMIYSISSIFALRNNIRISLETMKIGFYVMFFFAALIFISNAIRLVHNTIQ